MVGVNARFMSKVSKKALLFETKNEGAGGKEPHSMTPQNQWRKWGAGSKDTHVKGLPKLMTTMERSLVMDHPQGFARAEEEGNHPNCCVSWSLLPFLGGGKEPFLNGLSYFRFNYFFDLLISQLGWGTLNKRIFIPSSFFCFENALCV